jgi:hypothetical protein
MVPYLKLLPTPPRQESPDYAGIYKRLIRGFLTTHSTLSDKDLMKRLCYLGIKGLPAIHGKDVRRGFEKNLPSEEVLDGIWELIELTKMAMSGLTPNEFMTVFPIDKQYDGDRYEVKDYFSTMEELRKIGMDMLIGSHVDSLLFDYQNLYVRKFNVFKFIVLDCIREYEGEPSVMEAFMAEHGVFPETFIMEKDGKQFLYDSVRQTCYPLIKSRPRYLRVVK